MRWHKLSSPSWSKLPPSRVPETQRLGQLCTAHNVYDRVIYTVVDPMLDSPVKAGTIRL